MIDNCFNPACNKELHFLREGRIVRVVHGKGEDASIEHFWLCGTCSETHEFLFPRESEVRLGVRAHREAPVQYYFEDDLLIPWPQSHDD